MSEFFDTEAFREAWLHFESTWHDSMLAYDGVYIFRRD